MAYRPCQACRLWMWDPETGEREMARGLPVLRPKQAWTQCEIFAERERMYPGQHNAEPCPKGHWQDEPDLKAEDEAFIDLYMAVKTGGGTMLTDAERLDPLVMAIVSALAKEDAYHARRCEAEHRQVILAALTGSR